MGYWWIIRSPILFAYLVRLSVSLFLSLTFVFNFVSLHLDNVLKTIQMLRSAHKDTKCFCLPTCI